jgi:hypothetical protein
MAAPNPSTESAIKINHPMVLAIIFPIELL